MHFLISKIKSFHVAEFILLALALYFPFEPFVLKFIPDPFYVFARYLPELAIYGVFLFALVVGRRHLRQYRYFLPLIFLILIAFASAFINHTPYEVALLGTRQIIRFILIFYCAVLLNFGELFSRKLLGILFGILLFQGVLGIIQAGVGAPLDQLLLPAEQKVIGDIQLTRGTPQFWESGQRVFGTMGRYDQLGTFITLILLIIAGFLYQWKVKKDQWHLMVIFTLALPTLLLTYSRASWFGLIIGVVVIGYVICRDRRIAWTGLGIAGLAGAYIIFSVLSHSFLIDVPNQTIVQRFFEAFSLERWKGEYTGLGRVYFIVQTPAKIVAHSPLLGVGPGSYGAGTAAALHYTKEYDAQGLPFGIHGNEGHIDNNWFSLWGELGTIGLGIYIWLVILLVRMCLSVFKTTESPFYRALSLGYLGIIAAVTFQAFLATYLEVRTLAFYFWLIGGLIAAEEIRIRGSKKLV